MSNEIAKSAPDYFGELADSILANRIVGDLLTFSKFGEFLAGREKHQVPLGTRFVAHMLSMMTGHVRWEDDRPVEQVMGPVVEGFKPSKRADLGHLDKSMWETDDDGNPRDPSRPTNYLILSDPESGQLYTFTTSSRGGFNAIGELAKAYSHHIRQSPDDYPLIELAMSSYRHANKAYGEIRVPSFKVVDWVPRADYAGLLDGTASGPDTDQAGPAPKALTKVEPEVASRVPTTSSRADTKKAAKAPPPTPRF
jgi:hypothetical protein